MRKRVLIVDDVAEIRSALRSSLESATNGLVVCGEAADGLEAIEKARELHPDLIVLDFAMPRMNGIEAAAILSREMPGVPVILFTMHAGSVVERSALAAGVRVVISKSDPEQLIQIVARFVMSPDRRGQGT